MLACFIGTQDIDVAGLSFSVSAELKTELLRSMARNEKEYDCFRSHFCKICHLHGSCKCILNRIYKNCITLPTFLLVYPHEVKYLDGLFLLKSKISDFS